MKADTAGSDSSYSRIIRPGFLGPVSHCVMLALTFCKVVPPEVILQSSVSWFQRIVVIPKTSNAIALTLTSVSP